MNYAIGFVAGAIATVAGIWFGIRLAREGVREEQRRKVEHNLVTYGTYILPPAQSATNGQEDEDEAEERKAA